MKTRVGYLITLLLALLLAMPITRAQSEAPASEVPAFTQAELDQMLAPIALYPDSLLSQILMAATYPLEVVQAARWSKANPGLQGEQAVRAVDDRDWDPSVKSLVAFPQILAMMDEKLDWTERLGDAFLAQPGQVMDTVQSLRQKAYAAGNLKSNDHYYVEHQPQTIVITSPYPDVIYVPYYDPYIVYGGWWWPAYRPVYWGPWPGYYSHPGVVFYWSVGIRIGHGFFFGVCDWRDRHIRVVEVHPFYYRRPPPPKYVWVHEYEHRRGVPYRHPTVHKKYVTVNTPAKRYDYSERTRKTADDRDQRADRSDKERGPITRKPDEQRIQPRHDVGRESRPDHVDQRKDDRRGPPLNVERDDKPGRTAAPVTRPDPIEQPPMRIDHGRGQKDHGAESRGHNIKQDRISELDKATVLPSSGRSADKLRDGDPRDLGEARRK